MHHGIGRVLAHPRALDLGTYQAGGTHPTGTLSCYVFVLRRYQSIYKRYVVYEAMKLHGLCTGNKRQIQI